MDTEDLVAEPSQNERKKYALVVGVNQSTNMRRFPSPLRYAESDAAGISYLLSRKPCNFASPIPLLIGPGATTHSVRRAITDLIDGKSENDLLLFYFIGHGYSIEVAKGRVETYLVTSDFDPDPSMAVHNPRAYLSLSEIRETLYEHHTTAGVICILDCCHAGTIVEPPPPEQQLTHALEAFVNNIANITQTPTSSHRTWVTLASTGPEASAYERRGHAFMTGLIIDMLNGEIQGALDHDGNLTLLTLYNYLQNLRRPEGQNPIMHGRFGSFPWVLAQHPSENPVLRRPEEYPQSPLRQPFDMSPSPAVFLDLDHPRVEKFLKADRVKLQEDYQAGLAMEAQMQALGLMQSEHLSYGALLCLGQKRFLRNWIESACTRCTYWGDTGRQSGPLNGDNEKFEGNLLQQFAKARDFLKERLGIRPDGSSERPEIPVRALEEALANALVHREYVTEPDRVVRTEGVRVEIFSDRVEITSPGGPPVPLNPNHPGSHPRNSQIMRIFYLAGYVEELGTGLIRIKNWIQEAGLREPDIRANQQTFTITLYRLPISPSSSGGIDVQPNGDEPIAGDSSKENDPTITVATASQGPQTQDKPRVLIREAIIALIFLVVGAGAGYFGGHLPLSTPYPGSAPSTTIEIASDFPTSGLDTTFGLPEQNGVQMAITEANNEHLLPGYTLKSVPYDDVGSGHRDDPQVGANNLKQAIADSLVAGVIGPYNSSVAFKQLPLANKAPLALLSPGVTFSCLTKSATDDPACTEIYDIAPQMRPTSQLTFFRLVTTTDRQGKANADYFFQTKHYSKVLLLKDDSDVYSFGLAHALQTEWQRIGGLVISVDLPQNGSGVQNYQNTLQAAASSQPDLIYFAGDDPNGSYVLQALSKIATLKTVPFAGGGAIMDSSLLQTVASLHRDAPVYVSPPLQDPAQSRTATGTDFATNYTANGYQDYRPYAATAYDCTMMLIQAIKTALQTKGISTPHGTQDHAGAVQFRQAVLQALRHLSYKGATGTHSFDASGDTTNHTVSFYQADLSTAQPSWNWLQQVNA